jgi:hypothetical protein
MERIIAALREETGWSERRAQRFADSAIAPVVAERDALRAHLLKAEDLANAVTAYFNKRGAAHSDRKGNEDIAAMADALSDYGHQTGNMFARRKGEPS